MNPRERILVSLAVMIDGSDAVLYLENDKHRGLELGRIAKELVDMPIDIRTSLVGTLMRKAIFDLSL